MVTDKIAPVEPDTIPHISPITSLQKEDTCAAFFLNFTATLAPLTFLDAIEWKGDSSAAVTATPTISNKIPIPINKIKIMIPIHIFTFGITVSDNNENIIDKEKAITDILIIHL